MTDREPINETRLAAALAGLISLDPAYLDGELRRVVALDWPGSSTEGNLIAEVLAMREAAVDLFQRIDALYD